MAIFLENDGLSSAPTAQSFTYIPRIVLEWNTYLAVYRVKILQLRGKDLEPKLHPGGIVIFYDLKNIHINIYFNLAGIDNVKIDHALKYLWHA